MEQRREHVRKIMKYVTAMELVQVHISSFNFIKILSYFSCVLIDTVVEFKIFVRCRMPSE